MFVAMLPCLRKFVNLHPLQLVQSRSKDSVSTYRHTEEENNKKTNVLKALKDEFCSSDFAVLSFWKEAYISSFGNFEVILLSSFPLLSFLQIIKQPELRWGWAMRCLLLLVQRRLGTSLEAPTGHGESQREECWHLGSSSSSHTALSQNAIVGLLGNSCLKQLPSNHCKTFKF